MDEITIDQVLEFDIAGYLNWLFYREEITGKGDKGKRIFQTNHAVPGAVKPNAVTNYLITGYSGPHYWKKPTAKEKIRFDKMRTFSLNQELEHHKVDQQDNGIPPAAKSKKVFSSFIALADVPLLERVLNWDLVDQYENLAMLAGQIDYIQKVSPKPESNEKQHDKDLTLPQIALLYIYRGTSITSEAQANKIVKDWKWKDGEKRKTGINVYKSYHKWKNQETFISALQKSHSIKAKNKAVRDLEAILDYLTTEQKRSVHDAIKRIG